MKKGKNKMTEFEEIYEENYSKLYTIAFRMAGNKDDAEDILKNTFMKAYKAFGKFRNQSSVYTWLYRIVVNESKKLAIYTKKLPVDKFAEEDGLSSADVFKHINSFGQVEDEVILKTTKETCLQFFMNCMPVKYRIVFVLRVILQFTNKETAEILEKTENLIKVNLHRARMMLKELSENRCSLINPKNPCRCSSWAKYMMENKEKFSDCHIYNKELTIIKQKEQNAVKEFEDEMNEIMGITKMYNTFICSGTYELFSKKIKEMMKEGRLKMLSRD